MYYKYFCQNFVVSPYVIINSHDMTIFCLSKNTNMISVIKFTYRMSLEIHM